MERVDKRVVILLDDGSKITSERVYKDETGDIIVYVKEWGDYFHYDNLRELFDVTMTNSVIRF